MKIDVFTTVMAIVFILAIFGPMVYLEVRRRNRIKNMRSAYLQYIHALKLLPGYFETWSNKALALDKTQRTLVVLRESKDGFDRRFIDLTNAATCRVLATKDQVILVIDKKFGLEQMPEPIKLFDDNVDDPLELGFHKVLAKRWADRINRAIIKTTRKPRRAA